MTLRHMFDNRQAQTGATGFARTASIDPIKALGQAPQMLSGNAGACIQHRKDQAAVCTLPYRHRDLTTRWGITHRIADQVTHCAEQLSGRSCQVTVKRTVKDKSVIRFAHHPHHLRQSQCVSFKLAHQYRHRHQSLQARRRTAFKS
jgi:hypothetical protein